MQAEVIIFSLVNIVFLVIVVLVLNKKSKEERQRLAETYDMHKNVLDEKIKHENSNMENRKDAIKEMIDRIYNKINESQKDHINLKTALEEHKAVTSGLKETTDNLKNLLSNNQLRGKYGEEVAESLLQLSGFVRGIHYLVNTVQETISTRPDFTIFLPDKTKINIDSKFPFQALVRYQNTDNKSERDTAIKEFANDVKTKVNQIASREYINPEENTVDFAIMFVPNEMIFSFIYDQMQDTWKDALKKKVILTGPFSFTAILRMVYQSYKTFKYKEDLYEIIKLIKVFEREYEKYSEEFDKVGQKIEAVDRQFRLVSITRSKKLTGVIEKIVGADILPERTEPITLDRPDENG